MTVEARAEVAGGALVFGRCGRRRRPEDDDDDDDDDDDVAVVASSVSATAVDIGGDDAVGDAAMVGDAVMVGDAPMVDDAGMSIGGVTIDDDDWAVVGVAVCCVVVVDHVDKIPMVE